MRLTTIQFSSLSRFSGPIIDLVDGVLDNNLGFLDTDGGCSEHILLGSELVSFGPLRVQELGGDLVCFLLCLLEMIVDVIEEIEAESANILLAHHCLVQDTGEDVADDGAVKEKNIYIR